MTGDARAARQGAERRDRRRVAAPRGHRHRPHRADAAGRRRADVPLPRQLARSVRPPVRAEAVAVHDRRRQRLDPRRRRAGRRRSPAGRRRPSTRSTCGCSTTRCRTRRRSARARPAAGARSSDLQLVGEDTQLRVSRHGRPATTSGSRCRRRATRTSASCRGSSATSAAPAARELTAAIDGPLRQPLFSGSATITDGRIRHFSLPNSLDAINGTIRFDRRRHPPRRRDGDDGRRAGAVRRPDRLRRLRAGDLNVTARGEDMHLRVSGGHPLGRRRRSVAARQRSRRRRSAAR